MSSFTDPLILEAMPKERAGRGLFRLYQEFGYEIGYKGSGDWVRVPRNYITDLCSIPWFARSFLPLSGKVAKPAVLHDWLIDHDDERAADIFNEALEVAGVRPRTRKLLVFTVRWWQRWKELRLDIHARAYFKYARARAWCYDILHL